MADLVTISDYKDAEGITGPKEDLRISRIIPSVSELVKTYCGNSFVDFYGSDKTEDFDIYWDTYAVQLTESPIVSITSVRERSGYDQSYTTLTTGAYEYYLDTRTDSIIRTNNSGGRLNWKHGVGAHVTKRLLRPPHRQTNKKSGKNHRTYSKHGIYTTEFSRMYNHRKCLYQKLS